VTQKHVGLEGAPPPPPPLGYTGFTSTVRRANGPEATAAWGRHAKRGFISAAGRHAEHERQWSTGVIYVAYARRLAAHRAAFATLKCRAMGGPRGGFVPWPRNVMQPIVVDDVE